MAVPSSTSSNIAQVQCYSTLFELYGITVNRLVLVYVDDQTIMAKLVPPGSRREWITTRAMTLHRALHASEVPKPEVGPGCAYCPFVELCPKSSEAMVSRKGKS